MIRTRLLAIALSLLAFSAACAKSAATVTCRFISLKNARPPVLVNIGPKQEEIQIHMRPGTPSSGFACPKQGQKLLFLSDDDRQPAAEAMLPDGVRDAILVFGESGKSDKGLPWRVFVIGDEPKQFPAGGAYVANFHSQDIRFIIGEQKAMLRPAGSRGIARPEKRDEFNMAPVAFQFQANNEEWVTASETMLRFIPGIRYLILTSVDSASGRPWVTMVKDLKQLDAAATGYPGQKT